MSITEECPSPRKFYFCWCCSSIVWLDGSDYNNEFNNNNTIVRSCWCLWVHVVHVTCSGVCVAFRKESVQKRKRLHEVVYVQQINLIKDKIAKKIYEKITP